MIPILPQNFDSLFTAEREKWTLAQTCMNHLAKSFEITATSKPKIDDFYILASKSKPIYFSAWEIKKHEQSFKLCLVQYETSYTTANQLGGSTHIDTSFYLYGQLKIKGNFGTVLIRPETFGDKITELFVKTEVDFKTHPLFSYRYFVASDEPETLIKTLPAELIEFLEKIDGLQLEFRNQYCLFRLPKAMNQKEAVKLCLIGIELDKILNK
jgi:hypothetical protein